MTPFCHHIGMDTLDRFLADRTFPTPEASIRFTAFEAGFRGSLTRAERYNWSYSRLLGELRQRGLIGRDSDKCLILPGRSFQPAPAHNRG